MAHKKNALVLFLTAIILLNSGCFSAFHAFNTGGKTPVYLHVNKDDNYSYYVNGEKIDPEFTIYRSQNVSQTSTTTTIEHTLLPALRIKANKAYAILKVVDNNTKLEKQFILKSDLMEGAKIIMYFQGMFTLGIGNAIDMAANSVYAWPEITPTK